MVAGPNGCPITSQAIIAKVPTNMEAMSPLLVDQGKPYIVPMNYGYILEDDKIVFYCHGALEGRKLDIIRNNSDCCVQIACDYYTAKHRLLPVNPIV